MKFTSIAGALLTALILAGCEQPVTQKGTGSTLETKSLTVTNVSTDPTTKKYYSFETGAEVAADDVDSASWDVAFTYSSGGIFTNSGATATEAASGGAGGVYYTGASVFDDVTSYDASGFTGDFATDTKKYIKTDQGAGYPENATLTVFNVMTKLKYDAVADSGDGSTDKTPFLNNGSAAVYTGDAAFQYNETTHGVSANGHVYIVRNGDGSHYTKFQVTTQTLSSGTRTRVIKYANF